VVVLKVHLSHICSYRSIDTALTGTLLSKYLFAFGSFLNFNYLTVAAALKLFFDSITLKSSYFKVDSAKLYDISNPEGMSLILGAEVF
jgi:hypothetical protein